MLFHTVGRRLIAAVLVPVLALVLFAGMSIYQASVNARAAGQTQQLMDVSLVTGNLVHALQVERGTTSTFVQSRGERFADRIPGVRQTTDKGFAALSEVVQGIGGDVPNSIREHFSKIGELQVAIANLRQTADRFETPAKQIAGGYSDTIARLINGVDRITDLPMEADMMRQLTAYQIFLRIKENAGQERATVSMAFTNDHPDAALIRMITERINTQEALLKLFRVYAAPAALTQMEGVLAAEPHKAVVHYREILLDKAATGGFGVDPADWFKVISQKIDALHALEDQLGSHIKAQAEARRQQQQWVLSAYGLGFVVTLCLALGLAVLIARGVTLPLQRAIEAAETAVRERDFTRRVPSSGAAEVERAAQSFNELIQQFSQILVDTTRSSQRIAGVAKQLAESSSTASQDAGAAADSSSAVAAAMEEVSTSVAGTATHTTEAHDYVLRSQQDTSHALEVMSHAVSNIDVISGLLQVSGEQVQVLSESSQKIGGIIQVIKEIADQTNLLALNAAIEAARAGEHGRGFAVVADEVRKLAERTTSSTGEIASLVDTIQLQIKQAVSSMQRANDEAGNNKSLVADSETALRAMEVSASEIAARVAGIADAVREQNSGIQQVAENFERIAAITDQTRRVAVGNDQTARELETLADDLRASVARFKV